jgi:SAM-dependent MidA family methyltransferase
MRLRRTVTTVADERPMPWRIAMSEALYGENGFYVARGGPRRHFRTSAHSPSLWAEAICALATRVDISLGSPDSFTVIDVGAGGGEMLASLAASAPPRWSLFGVDVADRPAELPSRVSWRPHPPAGRCGLIVANELLDVVELDVAELAIDGRRLVEVTRSGKESLGGRLCDLDAQWQQRWWPLTKVGDRAEIGRRRDEHWRAISGCLDRGIAVAIDYAAVPGRDVAGTLTGFRNGRQVMPVPDGSCDLTAHVLFESLAAPDDVVMTQREALQLLGIRAARPTYDAASDTYLAALAAAGEAAELLDPDGLGGFTWLLHAVNSPHPLT